MGNARAKRAQTWQGEAPEQPKHIRSVPLSVTDVVCWATMSAEPFPASDSTLGPARPSITLGLTKPNFSFDRFRRFGSLVPPSFSAVPPIRPFAALPRSSLFCLRHCSVDQ
jgi:hypothetical protein